MTIREVALQCIGLSCVLFSNLKRETNIMAKNTATLKREWVKLLAATTKAADRAHNLLVEFGHHYLASSGKQ
jgi:hypothetical protein